MCQARVTSGRNYAQVDAKSSANIPVVVLFVMSERRKC